MRAFLHHFVYDFKTGVRDRSKLLMFYLFPLVFFVLVGGLMASINPVFKQTMIPAMVLFAFMCAALLSLPSLLVGAREDGVFRSYRINGVPSASILSIPVIGTAVHMAVIALIITLAGARIYGGVVPERIAGFVAAAILSYAAYAGIGVLIGMAAGNATVAILVGQLVYIPSIILGGLMVPSSLLPPALQRISLLLPATHSMRAFAGLGMGGARPARARALTVRSGRERPAQLRAGRPFIRVGFEGQPTQPQGICRDTGDCPLRGCGPHRGLTMGSHLR